MTFIVLIYFCIITLALSHNPTNKTDRFHRIINPDWSAVFNISKNVPVCKGQEFFLGEYTIESKSVRTLLKRLLGTKTTPKRMLYRCFAPNKEKWYFGKFDIANIGWINYVNCSDTSYFNSLYVWFLWDKASNDWKSVRTFNITDDYKVKICSKVPLIDSAIENAINRLYSDQNYSGFKEAVMNQRPWAIAILAIFFVVIFLVLFYVALIFICYCLHSFFPNLFKSQVRTIQYK